MGQLGFFDADKRLQALSARGDPLEAIDHLVPWESFRAEIEAVVLTPDELKKSSAGRKPFDAILMFRMLVLHYAVTDAAVHDSQELDGLLHEGNTCNDVFADSAYRSAKIESKLRASAYNSRIYRRGRRNHPLSLTQMRVNHAKSSDTRSHRACVRSAAERARRSEPSNICSRCP